jgi:hypothetical protein
MSKAEDGKRPAPQRLARYAPLPVRTFGDILAYGLVVNVWYTSCRSWGRADLAGRNEQRFSGAQFRCKCPTFRWPDRIMQRGRYWYWYS